MMMFILWYLFATVRLNTHAYQFDEGYVEFWYQIPITDIFFTPISSDSFKGEVSYDFVVYEPGGDSTVRQGRRVFFSEKLNIGDYVFDCFPLWLYPGHFVCKLVINTGGEVAKSEKKIAICSDTISFYSSDILLSKKKIYGSAFKRHDITFTPIISCTFSNLDTLFSYFEIYGLIPDSLLYEVRYQILNNKSKIVYDAYFKRPKYEYRCYDTISIFLGNFSTGNYTLKVEVFEPALNMLIQKGVGFKVKKALFDITEARYAREIKYLVSEKEYKKFLKMDYPRLIDYLKKFWSKRNYKEFEKRLLEADEKFSTSNLRGRDTNQGKFYILNGPPDEIEYRPMETTGAPAQVWYYESKGLLLLWCDSNGDGDYELMGNLDFEDDFTRDIPIKWTK